MSTCDECGGVRAESTVPAVKLCAPCFEALIAEKAARPRRATGRTSTTNLTKREDVK
jgi:hypothetical protein